MSWTHIEDALRVKPSRPPLTSTQRRALFAEGYYFSAPINWWPNQLEDEVELAESAALAEIQACGRLTTSSGLHPVENFYAILGWEGGTYPGMPSSVGHLSASEAYVFLSDLYDAGLLDGGVEKGDESTAYLKEKRQKRRQRDRAVREHWKHLQREKAKRAHIAEIEARLADEAKADAAERRAWIKNVMRFL